jgi:uncharacterized protein (TIGR02231 family)
MKKVLFVSLTVVIAFTLAFAAESKITDVTVFSDRAQVTRVLTETKEMGIHTLVFENLPSSIDQNSIQVNGSGNAILKDIKFEIKQFSEITDSDEKALYDKKQLMEDEINQLNNNANQISKEKSFIEKIAARLTANNEKAGPAELNPEKWIKMVEFYRSKLETLDADVFKVTKQKREIQKKLDKINAEISMLGRKKNKSSRQVSVKVDMKKAGKLSLELSYIVFGPVWYPVYDLRVSTDDKKMNINYNAVIKQNTGEDWKNIKISLSTANLKVGGDSPELRPTYVSEARNRHFGEDKAYRKLMGNAPSMSNAFEKSDGELHVRGGISNEIAYTIDGMSVQDPIQTQTTSVSSSTTAAIFVISDKNTILSDNQPSKVTIMIQDFDANFRYSTVPKLAQYAYLKAKVKNTSEYPLLAGVTNIFLDNNFVAKSNLKSIAPSEEFWTFLGIDEGMKVEYKLIKKFNETEGMISKKNKITYEYEIKINNNKKSQEEIVVWDQIPISQHENIKVELIKPEYKKDTDVLKMNKQKYIEWFFEPKAGQEIKIPFKYSVEYPKDMKIQGIN